MSEYTKGPWEIGFGGKEGDSYAVITSPHKLRAVCMLEPGDYEPANARLMSAAPELLQALKLITEQARSWHSFHHGSDIVRCDSICDLLPACDVAIAKAEGK